ncbi:MAG: hypothetical protein ACI35W_02580 [Anaeroplasmataceae bacterium]
MQSENVEIQAIEVTESLTSSKKEYEKIIKKEKNRQLNMRAQNLIKMGCFDQYERTSVDFSKLEKITYDKLYKKVYDLYQDEQGNLFYIYAKTEGESNKPYAFDIIAIETLNDDEYKQLYKASSYEGAKFIKILLISSIVLWALIILFVVAAVITDIVNSVSLIDTLVSLTSYFFNIALLGGIIGILSVVYRGYIGK